MENSNVIVRGGGFGLGSMAFLITTAFIVMKCAKISPIAEWSWLWVICPIWIYFGFLLSIIIFVMVVIISFAILATIFER